MTTINGSSSSSSNALFETLPLESFAREFGTTSTEVSSVALGGRIISCSDEWFAPASDLLKVGPALSMKGQFGPAGALFDGWETRRHNPEPYDWVIVRLGPAAGAAIAGFDVDTANFNGNEAPEVSIHGLSLSPEEEAATGATLSANDARVSPSVCDVHPEHLLTLLSFHSGRRFCRSRPADRRSVTCSSSRSPLSSSTPTSSCT